jgi:hypothetical protein
MRIFNLERLLSAGLLSAALLAAVPQQAATQSDVQKLYEDLIRSPIIPPRDAESIEADLNHTKLEAQQSGRVIGEAEARVREADGWISAEKREIDSVKRKVDAAKKDRREPDRLQLESQRKQLELVAEYLRRTREVRESEVEQAKAQKDVLDADLNVFNAELELRKEAEILKRTAADDPTLGRQTLAVAKSSESTLRLMKISADKRADVARRSAQIADRRVDLVQSRNKLLSEDRIKKLAEQQKEQ